MRRSKALYAHALVVLLLVATLASVDVRGAESAAVTPSRVVRIGDGSLIRAIRLKRETTHACQDASLQSRSRVAYSAERSPSINYRRWVLNLWTRRARTWCRLARSLSSPVVAIHAVFGRYGSQAVSVASCETGGTFDTRARNGQFLGLFQMGAYARSRFGHGWSALAQARAAFAYFRASGYSWGPWSCKP